MKKWYVLKQIGTDNFDNDAIWKPVDDVKFVWFDKNCAVAVVRDESDDRGCYCVHVARVRCRED